MRESHSLAQEYIYVDDVTAFCLNLMDKMRRNLIIFPLCNCNTIETTNTRSLEGFKKIVTKEASLAMSQVFGLKYSEKWTEEKIQRQALACEQDLC